MGLRGFAWGLLALCNKGEGTMRSCFGVESGGMAGSWRRGRTVACCVATLALWGGGVTAALAQCGQWWSAMGDGLNADVEALAVMPNGDVIATGIFRASGTTDLGQIARWNGDRWLPLGDGLVFGSARALAVLPNGDLIAGGSFLTAGGVPCNRIARWDGSSWHAMGAGFNGEVIALAVTSTGEVVAGGNFTASGTISCRRIAKWNGVTWTGLQGAWQSEGMNNTVWSVAVDSYGQIVAGGDFTQAGSNGSVNRLASWGGWDWQGYGTGVNGYVREIFALPAGNLIVGGGFTTAGGRSSAFLARWTSEGWQPVYSGLNGPVSAIAKLPNGDYVVGGFFTNPALRIAVWTPEGSLRSLSVGMDDAVNDVVVLPNGDVVAGGRFSTAGGVPSPFIATYRSGISITNQPDPSTVCSGSPVVLSVTAMGNALQYQWRKDGVAIPEATSAILSLTSTLTADSGIYDCVVSNACTTVASTPASLVVISPPTIAQQPQDQAASPGAMVSFLVQVQSETRCVNPQLFRYQWQRRDPAVVDSGSPAAWIDLHDGPQFVNTQTNALIIPQPIPALATGYRCRISGGCNCGVTYTDTVNFSLACPADFNADGGVDFTDVEAFFERWENGC
jgi:hypothetical protein